MCLYGTNKKNLPQINADQRRNNLRNSATSAGNTVFAGKETTDQRKIVKI